MYRPCTYQMYKTIQTISTAAAYQASMHQYEHSLIYPCSGICSYDSHSPLAQAQASKPDPGGPHCLRHRPPLLRGPTGPGFVDADAIIASSLALQEPRSPRAPGSTLCRLDPGLFVCKCRSPQWSIYSGFPRMLLFE